MDKKEQPLRGWLGSWLDEIAQSPPPPEIKALNFGLFEGMEGYSVYLIGAKEYDPEDDGWACGEDWCPTNEQRYAPGVIGQRAENGRSLSWRQAQALFAMQLQGMVLSGEYDPLFKGRVVTCGFDDGDLELLS